MSGTALKTSLFDYELPEELIAQFPDGARGESRMMVMDRRSGECEIHPFRDIVKFLRPGDAVIFNDTKVINARMYGRKSGLPEAALIEILLVDPLDPPRRRAWRCMIKPGKRVPPGSRVQLAGLDGELPSGGGHWFAVTEHFDDGTFGIEFDTDDFELLQERCGHIPLPPYIRRGDRPGDRDRYQTVYAREPGAVAAPTAGLHFTNDILAELEAGGVRRSAVTLHVGPGTFKPVTVEEVSEHRMHSERYELSPETAELVNRTRAAGGRVLAVGTTSVRVLESCAEGGLAVPRTGHTDIFIYPPYRPQLVDMLLTNFHLPQSTLIMLVSAFASREKVLAAYRLAVREKMRFFSYGDCMLLI